MKRLTWAATVVVALLALGGYAATAAPPGPRSIRQFDPHRLADLELYDAVGLSPAAAGEALSRLREEGFLREIHGGLEFRNELIRAQAYYAVAGPARRSTSSRSSGATATSCG